MAMVTYESGNWYFIEGTKQEVLDTIDQYSERIMYMHFTVDPVLINNKMFVLAQLRPQ